MCISGPDFDIGSEDLNSELSLQVFVPNEPSPHGIEYLRFRGFSYPVSCFLAAVGKQFSYIIPFDVFLSYQRPKSNGARTETFKTMFQNKTFLC